MNTYIIIAAIALAVMLIYVAWVKFHAERLPKITIIAFTGAPGSGKSTLASINSVKAYKRQKLLYSLRNLPFVKFFFPHAVHPASLYSNVPLRIGRNKWSEVLEKEHLLLEKILPEKAVIYIDEFGAIASQWEFDNPLVMEQLTTFVRFYRHFTDGKIFVCDQTSDSIVKPVRNRLGVIYYLYDFKRLLGFLPWVKISCIPLLDVEETSTRLTDDFDRYFIAFLPYRWFYKLPFFRKMVDSRCYSDLYFKPAKEKIERYDGYKTEYLIEIAVSDDVRKAYKHDRKIFKRYLYNKKEVKKDAAREKKGLLETLKNGIMFISASVLRRGRFKRGKNGER